MECKDCLPLIPGYVDQELSEPQSGPLRQHLMDCQDCRLALSGQKSLERWFTSSAAEEAEVPVGFAARVARRAFAGDLGRTVSELEGAVASDQGADSSTPIYSFVLWATSLAAAVLLIVSGMLFQSQFGEGENLHATGKDSTKAELLEEADKLGDPAFGTSPDVSPADVLEDMSKKTIKRADRDSLENDGSSK
ncbi:MAG: hypothetical protein ACI9F9_001641 [Candidatus Paceibacteria bacterium]|jgi:hypothetical protein